MDLELFLSYKNCYLIEFSLFYRPILDLEKSQLLVDEMEK
jgi:hypothetical protein